jgi:hypothetical protein
MKIKSLFLSVIAVVFSTQLAFAHGSGHGTPISDTAALKAATEAVSLLVSQKEKVQGAPLDASWSSVPETGKKLHRKASGFYIVSFQQSADKTLYVLISDQGEFYDANYTGKFEGVKE